MGFELALMNMLVSYFPMERFAIESTVKKKMGIAVSVVSSLQVHARNEVGKCGYIKEKTTSRVAVVVAIVR